MLNLLTTHFGSLHGENKEIMVKYFVSGKHEYDILRKMIDNVEYIKFSTKLYGFKVTPRFRKYLNHSGNK